MRNGFGRERYQTVPYWVRMYHMAQRKERKPNRLQGFDYSSEEAYFVTICVKELEPASPSLTGILEE